MPPQPAELEARIKEIIHELLEMPITPHVRELRAKAVTYGRVINNWSVYAPTSAQVQAMHECVEELHEKVVTAKRADVSRVQKKPVGSAAPGATTPSVPPAGVAWNANVSDTTSVRARRSANPRAAEAPTKPPPPPSSGSRAPQGADSIPPILAHNPVDTPTPVPALLRSRRSR